jgi:PTH1 family peptidyl-tRNA hydrolase
MRLVCGLGNPGALYANTRHNAGFMVVDWLAEKRSTRWNKPKDGIVTARLAQDVMLAKPDTFMNLSGGPVAMLARYHKVPPATHLLLVMDCAALEVGRIKLSRGGGHAGQLGTKSVMEQLATREFARLRVGIGPPKSRGTALADHVLGSFSAQEREIVRGILPVAADAIQLWLQKGIDEAMNEFNKTPMLD